MENSLLKSVRKKLILAKIIFVSLGSYIGFSMTQISVLAASDNMDQKGVQNFENYAKPSSNGAGLLGLANMADKFVPQIQGLGAVALVIFCVICGIKLGASSITSDPRTRSSAIWGIFYIIIGGVFVIHARQVVGMAVNAGGN